MNEINYLYENVVLPERKRIKPVITQLNNEKEENYCLMLKSKIYSEYDKFNDNFKNDPMYDTIISYLKQYVNSKMKEKIPTTPNEIKFYEKYGFTRIYEPLVQTEHFACDVRYIKKLK